MTSSMPIKEALKSPRQSATTHPSSTLRRTLSCRSALVLLEGFVTQHAERVQVPRPHVHRSTIRRVDVQCCRPLPRGAFKEGRSCDRARWHVAADAVAQSPGTASIPPPPPPFHRLLRHRLHRHPHRLPCSARVGARNRRQTGHHRRGAGQDGSSCREGALPPGHSDRPLQNRCHNLFGLALPAQWRTPALAPPAISKNTPSLAISLRRWLTKQHWPLLHS